MCGLMNKAMMNTVVFGLSQNQNIIVERKTNITF